jgi:predicted transcriptional regulator of viral defense system
LCAESYIGMDLKKLENKPFFTTQQASDLGISPRMLSYYVEKGEIERIAQGVYCSKGYEPKGENLKWEDLAIAASNIKGGVICLISALVYYELTDEMMKEFWIAVPNNRTRVNFPMSRIVRMRNIEMGVKEIEMAGVKVQIFDIERTIVDSFRLLDFEMAIKALKIYLSGKTGKPNVKKLDKYITELKASKVRDYLTAVVA